eukprot:CAMPEP_0113630156 /NCGR_PEP_ID=MMETSP0017_2-20120614/15664_1 /TAXON_ID=2856 /ORGANISM="Cylindrotheca closterium" /LENGTH=300 /DNA_ID=CAMNT_0000540601 /DNA_START=243 /DNA_END=1145 /DNA_ORIENTATION=+ /assembly_acc=CAM_ASM_000147
MGIFAMVAGITVLAMVIQVMIDISQWEEDCLTRYTGSRISWCDIEGSGHIYRASFGGAVSLIVAASLILVFACGSRLPTEINKAKSITGEEEQADRAIVEEKERSCCSSIIPCGQNDVPNKCSPYGNGFIIAGEVLTVLGFFLTGAGFYFILDIYGIFDFYSTGPVVFFVYLIALGVSLVACIMSTAGCYCACNKVGFVTMGIFAMIGGISVLATGIQATIDIQQRWDGDGSGPLYGFSFGAAVSLIVAASFIFVFACGSRLPTEINKSKGIRRRLPTEINEAKGITGEEEEHTCTEVWA